MRANTRKESASPDGLAAHVLLEGWSQVWMCPDLTDRRMRAGMRRRVEEKLGQGHMTMTGATSGNANIRLVCGCIRS